MMNYIIVGTVFFIINFTCYGANKGIEKTYNPPSKIPKEIINESLSEDFPVEETPIYDSVNNFFTTITLVNHCPVKIAGKWGVINDVGEITVLPKFDNSYSFEQRLEQVISGDCSNEHPKILCQGITKGYCKPSSCKTGYINKEGTLVISAVYESRVLYRENDKITQKFSGRFSEGLAEVVVRVKNDYLYGYIDLKGRMIIEPIFEEALPFTNGIAMVRYKGKNRKIDKKGNFISESKIFPEGEVLLDSKSEMFLVSKDHKFGFFSKEGKMILPVIYDNIITYKRDGKNYFHVKSGNKSGLFNEFGKPIVNLSEIDLYIDDYSDPDIFVFRNKNDSIGYMNFKGNIIIQPEFFMAYRPFDVMFHNGLADVRLIKNGQEKIINREGNIVKRLEMKKEYLKYVTYDKNRRGSFKFGPEIGLVDESGKIVIPIKYRRIKLYEDTYLAYHKIDFKSNVEPYTAYDKNGKILFESNNLREYKGARDKFIIFKKELIGEKRVYTFINRSGEYIPGTFFEAASDFNDKGIAIVKKGDRFGLINKKIEPVKLKLSKTIKNHLSPPKL